MTVAIIQHQEVQKMSNIELMKKMNKIIQSLKNCDKRFLIHDFVNQTPEDIGNYIELIFEPRTEDCGPKIVGANMSKYHSL